MTALAELRETLGTGGAEKNVWTALVIRKCAAVCEEVSRDRLVGVPKRTERFLAAMDCMKRILSALEPETKT